MAGFATFCGTLPCLEQLGIRPPEEKESMTAFLECLKNLKALVSLKIYTPITWSNDSTMARLDAEVQLLAGTIFSELHQSCPRLTALVISVDPDHPRQPREEYGYLQYVQFDEYGQKTTSVRSVEVQNLEYHEPASDIFYEYNYDIWSVKRST